MLATAIAHQRLFNQRIDGEQFKKPEEVVRWMGAIQSQDYLQSLWAIGLRMQSATVADIEAAKCYSNFLGLPLSSAAIHMI